jgi:hypothetical protein
MSFFNNALCMVNPLCSVTQEESLVGNVANEIKREVILSVLVTVLLIIIFQILPIMLIAVNCNPNSPVTYGIIAFLFPGVYLFQHAVRKYLIREKGYCRN